ncbi:hypothetical protein C8J56DRAFT_880705 [Mycena floridula]|nr:hypothetical protein C8J56DRAFT_880705 [Mycena floridula]
MHNKRDLTDHEKRLVDRLVAQYGPSDRALITLEKVFNFCHLVEQSTTEAQLIQLAFVWGYLSKIYNVHEPDNIIKEAPTEHYQLDHHQLAHIPARKHIEEIINFYTNRDPKIKPKPFKELFPTPKEGWTYELLPLTMDEDKHIFRQTLKKNQDGTYSSSGQYEEHLVKIDLNKLKEIKKQLALAAPDLLKSIRDIMTLRELWLVPKVPEGQKTVAEAKVSSPDVAVNSPDKTDAGDIQDLLAIEPSQEWDPDNTSSPELDESDPEVSGLVSSFTVSFSGAASEPGSRPTWSAPARHDTRPPSTRLLDDNPPDTISDSSRKRKPSRSPSASPGQPILGDSLGRPVTQRCETGIPVPATSGRPSKAPRTLSESAARTIKDGSGPVANAPAQRPKFTWGPYDKTSLPSTSRGELGSAGSARSSGTKLQAQLPPEIPVHRNLTDGGIIITPETQAFHDTVTGKISRTSSSYPNSTSSIPRFTGRRPDDDHSSGSRRARPSNSGTGNPRHRPIAGHSVTENNSVTSTSGSRGSSNSGRARRTLPGNFGSTTPKPESPDEPKI